MIKVAAFDFLTINYIGRCMSQRIEHRAIGAKEAKATYKSLRRDYPEADIYVTITAIVHRPWIRRKRKGRAS